MLTRNFKKCSVVIVVIFLISAFLGAAVKTSYHRITKDEMQSTIIAERNDENGYFYDYETFMYAFEKAQSEADLIAVVTVDFSENQYLCTKATATINQVIEGENIRIGEKITILEPSCFYYSKAENKVEFGQSYAGCNIMQQNEKYLVFLQKKDYSPSYESSLKNKTFVYKALGSVFRLNYTQKDIINPDKLTTYSECSDFDFMTSNKDSLEAYNKFKKSVLNLYGME